MKKCGLFLLLLPLPILVVVAAVVAADAPPPQLGWGEQIYVGEISDVVPWRVEAPGEYHDTHFFSGTLSVPLYTGSEAIWSAARAGQYNGQLVRCLVPASTCEAGTGEIVVPVNFTGTITATAGGLWQTGWPPPGQPVSYTWAQSFRITSPLLVVTTTSVDHSIFIRGVFTNPSQTDSFRLEGGDCGQSPVGTVYESYSRAWTCKAGPFVPGETSGTITVTRESDGYVWVGWWTGSIPTSTPTPTDTPTATPTPTGTPTSTPTPGRCQIYLPFVARTSMPPSLWDGVEVGWRVVSPTMWESYITFGEPYRRVPRLSVLEFELCPSVNLVGYLISLDPKGFGPRWRDSILVSSGHVGEYGEGCKIHTSPTQMEWGWWEINISLLKYEEDNNGVVREESRTQLIWVDSPYDVEGAIKKP